MKRILIAFCVVPGLVLWVFWLWRFEPEQEPVQRLQFFGNPDLTITNEPQIVPSNQIVPLRVHEFWATNLSPPFWQIELPPEIDPITEYEAIEREWIGVATVPLMLDPSDPEMAIATVDDFEARDRARAVLNEALVKLAERLGPERMREYGRTKGWPEVP